MLTATAAAIRPHAPRPHVAPQTVRHRYGVAHRQHERHHHPVATARTSILTTCCAPCVLCSSVWMCAAEGCTPPHLRGRCLRTRACAWRMARMRGSDWCGPLPASASPLRGRTRAAAGGGFCLRGADACTLALSSRSGMREAADASYWRYSRARRRFRSEMDWSPDFVLRAERTRPQ